MYKKKMKYKKINRKEDEFNISEGFSSNTMTEEEDDIYYTF